MLNTLYLWYLQRQMRMLQKKARNSKEYWKLLSTINVRKIPRENNIIVTSVTDIPGPLRSDFSDGSFLPCLK